MGLWQKFIFTFILLSFTVPAFAAVIRCESDGEPGVELRDFLSSGRYRGLLRYESLFAAGEMELSVGDSEIRLRVATGSRLIDQSYEMASYRLLSEAEVRARFRPNAAEDSPDLPLYVFANDDEKAPAFSFLKESARGIGGHARRFVAPNVGVLYKQNGFFFATGLHRPWQVALGFYHLHRGLAGAYVGAGAPLGNRRVYISRIAYNGRNDKDWALNQTLERLAESLKKETAPSPESEEAAPSADDESRD